MKGREERSDEEDVPEEEQLKKFREVRDEIEAKILHWLEHPEEELAKLRAQREQERQERLRAARRETRSHNVARPVADKTGSATGRLRVVTDKLPGGAATVLPTINPYSSIWTSTVNSTAHFPRYLPAIIDTVSEDQTSTDLRLMRRALLAAESAAERGEVPVGAVVARGGEILAVAANERETTNDPTAHAELRAIRRAAAALDGWRLTGCTLYSTLEPCPMCAGAAHAARLDRLVYAAPDPKAGYAGTLHNTPADGRLNHTLIVERGLLEAEAAELLQDFFKNRRIKP